MESDTSGSNKSNSEVERNLNNQSPAISENNGENATQNEASDTASAEKEFLMDYITEAEARIASKMQLRNKNQTAQRPDESVLVKLDSSLKKNTAFVRKVRNFTATQLDSLLKDMSCLNLSKYISEVASALVEAKLKLTDVPAALTLCSALHCTYIEFSKVFLEHWVKCLTLKKDEKIKNPSKLRVDLRFYGDLVTIGIFPYKEALPLLGNCLTILTTMDREEHNNISIVLSFCKHCGEDYAGLVPRSIRLLSEKYNLPIPRSSVLLPEKQKNVKSLLKDYYVSLCKHLKKEHEDMQAFERQNRRILQTKGELNCERKGKSEALTASMQKLMTGANNFSEAIDEDLPALPDDKSLTNLEQNPASEGEDIICPTNLWEDEETLHFYQDYSVTLNMPNLPKETEQISSMSVEKLDEDLKEDELEDDLKKDEEIHSNEIEEPEDNDNSANNVNDKALFDAFLNNLPNCVNRDMIDNAAVEFLMNHNTKQHRKKLVKVLFGVPRTRLDLLPFYARLVAMLNPYMPEVAQDLVSLLKYDFRYHVRKKDQINIESKIKVIRFIGELVKFRLYSKIEGLYCLKVLLHDFNHHHIEMTCNLLESCGRFFYRHADTYQRTKIYLEQMMRKKAVMALDSRYVTMIENAYFYVNPPETYRTKIKERPIMHEFIRKTLYQVLMQQDSDEHVLNMMRSLKWDDHSVSAYAIKCLTNAFNVKYYHIRSLANLLAGLVDYQEFVGAQVVDGVLEDIRIGMELNLPKLNQRRVAMVKYLGELYNYRMVESSDIFKVLYSLISFGVTMDHEIPTPYDPSDNLFRIRLICVILETCGHFFSHGLSKTKLDYFFIYFQNYFWFKHSNPVWNTDNPFPVSMDYLFRDTIRSLRPNIQLMDNYEDAKNAVTELQNKLLAKVGSAVNLQQGDNDGLETITESLTENSHEEWEYTSDEEMEDDVKPCRSPVMADCTDSSTLQFVDRDVDKTDLKDWIDYEGEDSEELSDVRNDTPISEEDEAFQNAFEKMVSDNMQERTKDNIKPQQIDIPVPLHIKSSIKKTYEQLIEPEQNGSAVTFTLMIRKGNKQQYKNLTLPKDSELAQNLRSQEKAEKMEKERVKQLTLDINDRLEEEDYQDQIAQIQRPTVVNLNRERRHKYHHPKGAPDADLIFGRKKIQR